MWSSWTHILAKIPWLESVFKQKSNILRKTVEENWAFWREKMLNFDEIMGMLSVRFNESIL